jgi:hypothetical protein
VKPKGPGLPGNLVDEFLVPSREHDFVTALPGQFDDGGA